jgi:hypothetical protein
MPAARFTVSPGYDEADGEALHVNEVQGKDWGISIHLVWLGAPSEHRDARLRSPTGEARHITYGCIDVEADIMRRLVRRLPHTARTPLHIVPLNENLITTLFRPHDGECAIAGRAPPPAIRVPVDTRLP